MKPALLALLGLLAASSSAPQARHPTADPAKPTVCSVSGLVVKLEGSAPLPSSTVRLQSVDDHTRTVSGVTDLGGRFEVKGIDPRRYRLRVIRNGYVTQEYGQRTPSWEFGSRWSRITLI
jgi:Carboxypeptidase regulatory-like domain